MNSTLVISTGLLGCGAISGYIGAMALQNDPYMSKAKNILLTASSFSLFSAIILAIGMIMSKSRSNIILIGVELMLIFTFLLYIIALIELKNSGSKTAIATTILSMINTLANIIVISMVILSSRKKIIIVKPSIETKNPILIPPYDDIDGASKQLRERSEFRM